MSIQSHFKYVLTAVLVAIALSTATVAQELPDRSTIAASLHRAVRFCRQHASAGGGYVYQLSADLSKREGEGKVGPTTAWIEPPATPAVGLAYLESYRLCREPLLLEAAMETAGALLKGQLRSGGWGNRIEFDPQTRRRFAYRLKPHGDEESRNVTTFDDDKTQSAIRFLIELDRELRFENKPLNEAAHFALGGILKAQYPNGGWPQRFDGGLDHPDAPVLRASVPQTWARDYPAKNYTEYYTLNDHTTVDLIRTLLDAWAIYDDSRYLRAAQRGGDFLLLAQLPEPQPGWAQQYDLRMQPAWARKFEPPAVTGGESQTVMRMLIELYRRTAAVDPDADRYLQPLPRAIEYYRSLLLTDGRLARFYELGTDRPLYFTRDYQLTYDPSDLPTHYGFITGSALDQITNELQETRQTPIDRLWKPEKLPQFRAGYLDLELSKVIAGLDERGAWVEPGRLKYHGADDPTRRVIRSRTFSRNIRVLAAGLGQR